MSESTERVLGIKTIPIFPLPVVLFPNEMLPLHIFEPRYRKMLKDIEVNNRLFGLSYLNNEEMDSGVPEIGSLGCLAEVRESHQLEDGRSNIMTIGIIRYEVEEYVESDEPYLVAKVNFFEDFDDDEEVLRPLSDRVFGLFRRVALAAQELSGQMGQLPELPQAEPQMLSFLVAAAFNLPVDVKTQFLETRSTVNRLEKMEEILKQAVDQVEESASLSKVAKTNGHSNKKIDLDNSGNIGS